MGDTSNFFEELKDTGDVKLRILGKYVPPWAAKLGYKARARGQSNLWYVDGFAGEGRYADGADGSPIIAARQAGQLMDEGRDYRLGCVNVELNKDRARMLDQNTEEFRARGVAIRNLNLEFSESIPVIMEIIGQDDPALVFIDPFGIKPLKFDRLVPLLGRSGEVDLFLTFMTSALPRLATENRQIISDAIGTDTWTQDTILRELRKNLIRAGRFLGVASYAIRTKRGSAPRYHLLLASRSDHAFLLMNDSVVEEEEDLDRKWFKEASQANFFGIIDDPGDRKRLKDAVDGHARGHQSTTREAIVRDLVLNRFGEWHTGDIKKAVMGMIDGGRIVRVKQGRGHIHTDLLRFE